MIVQLKAHKRIVALLVIISMIGVIFLMKMLMVLGISAYINAESKKDSANHEVIAAYYTIQAKTGDFMEPYIAYYNAGTSYAKANQPERAEHMLSISLSKVDYDYNECYVRNNLAKVQEQLGDYYMVSDMASTAETYYAKAITTIQEAPGVCFPPPPPSGGEGEEKDPNAPPSGNEGEEKDPNAPPTDGEEKDPNAPPKEGEGEQESDKKEDQDGNPLTPQDDTPKDVENGEEMKETEERSKEKEGEAKEAQGKTGNGKEKIQNEMDQSKSETQTQEDMAEQKQNQSPVPVDKPW